MLIVSFTREEGMIVLAPQVDALRRIANLKSRHRYLCLSDFRCLPCLPRGRQNAPSARSVRGSPLSREGRPRLPDENTQLRNRDIKIMKQIPREIGSAGAGTMRTSIELYATSLHRFKIDIWLRN